MNVGILGSSGMIGSAICKVVESSFSLKKFSRKADPPLRLDLTTPQVITPQQFSGLDALVHCAGVVDEDFSQDLSQAYLKGTAGAKYLLNAALEAGVRRFVYISSAHIYGPLNGRITEENPPAPVSDYAIAHYATEQIFRQAAVRAPENDVHVLILRPCATYGMPEALDRFNRWSLVPFYFPKQAVEHGKISLLPGSDSVARNFVSAEALGHHVAAFLSDPAPPAILVKNPVGPYSATIFDFAKLCGTIYEDLVGQSCPVAMPIASPESNTSPLLDYRSLYTDQPPGEDIKTYLTQMTTYLHRTACHG